MNVEQRLIAALRTGENLAPSEDLWSRVVHSIEEDRAHRRRVVNATIAALAGVVAFVLVGLAAATDGPIGTQVRVPVMEAIETAALVALVVVLGPAIRRFGRNYATDLWPSTPGTATALLRLYDVAYVLVFSGFILMTAEFDTGSVRVAVAEQVQDLCVRVGGLLLVMGLLHAATIIVMPFVALVSNSTRVGRKLPRWLTVILVVIGGGVGVQVAMAMLGLLAGSS